MAGATLFAEMTPDVGTLVGAFTWAWKLAMLSDGGGVSMAEYGKGSGMDLSQAQVGARAPHVSSNQDYMKPFRLLKWYLCPEFMHGPLISSACRTDPDAGFLF